MLSIGVEGGGLNAPIWDATDALGGAAPNPITLPQHRAEGKAGGGRAVQGETLKASGQSSRLVLTPRLPV